MAGSEGSGQYTASDTASALRMKRHDWLYPLTLIIIQQETPNSVYESCPQSLGFVHVSETLGSRV